MSGEASVRQEIYKGKRCMTLSNRKSDIGSYYEQIQGLSASYPGELSFLHDKWSDIEAWRTTAREKVRDLLSYDPPKASLNPATISRTDMGGYIREEVEFNVSALSRISGTLLIPKQGKAPFPAVVALHDHGGYYYHGREKLLDTPDEPEILRAFKEELYEGVSWATEIVKEGYVVLIIDAFYFGERRVDYDSLSDEIKALYGDPLKGLEKDSEAYIKAFNEMSQKYEAILIKHILTAGATWAGIMAHDDRVSVDYLLTRPEVDPKRIGCAGLSLGGYRAALLAGTDPRISCAVVTGWMPSYQSLLHSHLRDHTYMVYIPGLLRHMEFPDILSTFAPNPLFVQQCRKDSLYPEAGMQEAADRLEAVYQKAGTPERFQYAFYDCPHCFGQKMQKEAFAWLREHL